MVWGIYVVIAIFQRIHTKPLIYLLLQWEIGDSTSLHGTSVASMTFGLKTLGSATKVYQKDHLI